MSPLALVVLIVGAVAGVSAIDGVAAPLTGYGAGLGANGYGLGHGLGYGSAGYGGLNGGLTPVLASQLLARSPLVAQQLLIQNPHVYQNLLAQNPLLAQQAGLYGAGNPLVAGGLPATRALVHG